MTSSTRAGPKRLFALVLGVGSFIAGCDQMDAGGANNSSKLTKESILKVTDGMSIDDAKLILGPPTNDVSELGYMEWGNLGQPGPYVSLEFDKESLKITRKKVIGLE